MRIRIRVLLSLFVALAMMGMAGCGHYTCSATFGASSCTPSGGGLGTTGGSSANSFFYFLNDDLGQMGLEELTTSSSTTYQYQALTGFSSPTLSEGFRDGGAIVVKQKFLYIPFSDGNLYGFSIDGTAGAVTAVPNSPYTVTAGYSIASDPAGNFVFVGDSSGGVTAFVVNSTDGSLTQVGTAVSSGVFPVQLATDGAGKFLYITEGQGGSQVAVMSNQQGVLSPIVNSPFTTSIGQIAGEPSGKFMLGIKQDGSGTDNNVYVFGIASDGSLAQVSGSPFATTHEPINMVVHPNGAWVYTFSQDLLGNLLPVEGYSLTSAGALQVLGSSPYTSVLAGVGQFDQSGKYLFGITEVIVSGGTQLGDEPFTVDTGTGALSSAISPLGFPGLGSFVVTDAPTN